MSFGSDLQALKGKNGLADHIDSEIASFVALKDFVAVRVSIEKEFAEKMRKAVKKAKDQFDKAKPAAVSGTVDACRAFVSHYEDLAGRMDMRNDEIGKMVTNELATAIEQKQTLKDDYTRQRKSIESDIDSKHKEVTKLQAVYDKAAAVLEKADEKKTKKETKGGKGFDQAVEERNLKERQMVEAHNEYVLMVEQCNALEESNSKSVLKEVLTTIESLAKFQVGDSNAILTALCDHIDHTKEDEQTAIAHVRELTSGLDADAEYAPLLVEFKSNAEESIEYEKFTPANQPCIANSTRNAIQSGGIEKEGVEEELDVIRTTAQSEADTNTGFAEEKAEAMKRITDANEQPMTAMNATLEDPSKRAEEVQKYRSLRAQLEEKVRHESEAAGYMAKVTAIDGGSSQSSSGGGGGGDGGDYIGIDGGDPDSFELRDQVWYHGVLARAKVNEWLTEKGDFLVRESANNATKIVLSVFVNPDKKIKISHFQITEELGQYSFEGEAFDSIRELLDYHIATKEVITAKSKAVIIRGAKRTERPFTHDDVKQGKRLGKGNFGDVYMGTLEDGTLCALKTCKESVPNPERFLEEADTLNQYQHPNIVQIYGVVKRAPIWIVLELCTGGELLQYLRKPGVTVSVSEKTRWSYEAASGIAYLHTKNCIHRDLAARNCLLTGGDPNRLKISDFGMSRIAEDDEDLYTASTTARQIPIRWTAPEALEHLEYYTATDVWGYGIMMWEVYSGGKLPYAGFNNSQVRHEVVHNNYRLTKPDECPENVFECLASCWEFKKEDRPTMADIEQTMSQLNDEYSDQDA